MPRLPTAEDLGRRPTPQVRGNISQLRLETPRMGAEAQALVQFGNSIQGLGDTMAKLAIKDKAELDAARSEDSYNQYADGTLKFEYGDEESRETGWSNIRTGDAVKGSLSKEYRAKRDSLRKSIREGLDNDDQKRAFDQRADIVDRQFDGRLYKHVADQTQAYKGVVSEGVMEAERRNVALNWAQPGQIEMSILRTNMEVGKKARREGLDPSRPEDAIVIDTLKAISETQIHASVIDSMILAGKDSSASAYYASIKERLTAEAVHTIGMKVMDSAVEGDAVRAVNDVWEVAGPQGPNDPVRVDVMSEWLRDKFSDDPKAMNAAMQDLRSRAAMHNDGQREYNAGNDAAVLNAFHDGATLEDLKRLPEYWAAENREQLRAYVVNAGWTEQSRERARQQYEDGNLARNSFTAFWEVSSPKVLSQMSENQIMSLLPTMGPDRVETLMKMRRALDSSAKIHAATIDTELFKELATSAGMTPYKAKPSEHEKEQLGRLRVAVEDAIDEAQGMKNGKLTRAETRQVMEAAIDDKVRLMKPWYTTNTTLPAAVVKPEQRSKVYVPIDEIPEQWAKEAINYMKSTGSIPQDMDERRAKQAFRGRLQRAYGHSLTGGSTPDGNAILEGRDE